MSLNILIQSLCDLLKDLSVDYLGATLFFVLSVRCQHKQPILDGLIVHVADVNDVIRPAIADHHEEDQLNPLCLVPLVLREFFKDGVEEELGANVLTIVVFHATYASADSAQEVKADLGAGLFTL